MKCWNCGLEILRTESSFSSVPVLDGMARIEHTSLNGCVERLRAEVEALKPDAESWRALVRKKNETAEQIEKQRRCSHRGTGDFCSICGWWDFYL